jgi:hypothetical protein
LDQAKGSLHRSRSPQQRLDADSDAIVHQPTKGRLSTTTSLAPPQRVAHDRPLQTGKCTGYAARAVFSLDGRWQVGVHFNPAVVYAAVAVITISEKKNRKNFIPKEWMHYK